MPNPPAPTSCIGDSSYSHRSSTSRPPTQSRRSRLVAFDPSSSVIGYAVLESGRIKEAGRIRPTSKSDKDAQPSFRDELIERSHFPGFKRVESMLPDVREVLEQNRPCAVVVELPSGLAGTGSKQGSRSALATYGLAAGMVYQYARMLAALPDLVFAVDERTWTRSMGSKALRKLAAEGFFDAYDPKADPGADVADAITLAVWTWSEMQQSAKRSRPRSRSVLREGDGS